MLSLKRSHGLLCSGQCYGKISHFHMVGSDLKTSRGLCLSPRAWLAAEAPWLSRLQGWEVPLLGRQGLPRCPSLSPWDRPPRARARRMQPWEVQRDGCLVASPHKGTSSFPRPSTGNSHRLLRAGRTPLPHCCNVSFSADCSQIELREGETPPWGSSWDGSGAARHSSPKARGTAFESSLNF